MSLQKIPSISVQKKIGRVYLYYLGVLPALATLLILLRYGKAYSDLRMMLIFVLGSGAIGIYLAFLMSYQSAPNSVWRLALLILDGPILIALFQGKSFSGFEFAIETFLVDSMVVWVSMLLLTSLSLIPTNVQRLASGFVLIGAIGITSLLVWPYMQENLFNNWGRMGWTLFAIVEGVIVSPLLISGHGTKMTDSYGLNDFPWFIIILLALWVAALMVGKAIS